MGIFKFFKSVIEEMKLVTWPTPSQTRKDTSIVIWFAILFAIFIGSVDFIVMKVIHLIV